MKGISDDACDDGEFFLWLGSDAGAHTIGKSKYQRGFGGLLRAEWTRQGAGKRARGREPVVLKRRKRIDALAASSVRPKQEGKAKRKRGKGV